MAKCSLIIFNVIFMLAGIAMMALGIFVILGSPIAEIQNLLAQALDAAQIPQSYLDTLSYGIIALGAVSLLAGAAGCCGAIKESQCLLGVYLFILTVILAGEIALAVVAYLKTGLAETVFKKALQKAIPNGGFSSNSNSKRAGTMIILQQKLHCCGLVNGCQDWSGGVTEGCRCIAGNQANCSTLTNGSVTVNGTTCSASENVGNTGAVESIYSTDCYNAAINYVVNNKMTIGIFVAVVIAVEVLGICFACILCCNIRKMDYEAA